MPGNSQLLPKFNRSFSMWAILRYMLTAFVQVTVFSDFFKNGTKSFLKISWVYIQAILRNGNCFVVFAQIQNELNIVTSSI